MLFPKPILGQHAPTQVDPVELHSGKLPQAMSQQVGPIAVSHEIKAGQRVLGKFLAVDRLEPANVAVALRGDQKLQRREAPNIRLDDLDRKSVV